MTTTKTFDPTDAEDFGALWAEFEYGTDGPAPVFAADRARDWLADSAECLPGVPPAPLADYWVALMVAAATDRWTDLMADDAPDDRDPAADQRGLHRPWRDG